ncbi:MAG: DUF4258 domain-containing protein [Blastocatellia bacterium]
MDIRRIRRGIREDRYEFTAHALEEMDEDFLSEEDVRNAILSGSVVAELSDDPRGARFVVRGESVVQNIWLDVVGRFLPSGLLRIITVYALDEED